MGTKTYCQECAKTGARDKITYRYVWAWGEDGVCCDAHRPTLQSLAGQLSREITFHPLGEPAAAPPEMAGALELATEKVRELEDELFAAQRSHRELASSYAVALAERDEARGLVAEGEITLRRNVQTIRELQGQIETLVRAAKDEDDAIPFGASGVT